MLNSPSYAGMIEVRKGKFRSKMSNKTETFPNDRVLSRLSAVSPEEVSLARVSSVFLRIVQQSRKSRNQGLSGDRSE